MKLKCKLCKANIIVEKEKYIHLEDWNQTILISQIWAHLECYNTAIFTGQRNLEKQSKHLLDQMLPIVNELTEQRMEYDLK